MRRLLASLAVGLLAVACGDGGSEPAGPTVATVTLSQTSVVLTTGASVSLSASARTDAGVVVIGRPVTWTSSSASIVTVTQGGIVTGVAPGTATVTATIDGRSASAQVTVMAAVASVSVTAPATTVEVGQTLTLTAVARDAQNAPLPERTITWASSNEAIATVAGGLVTGRAPGTVTIQATSENVSGTLAIVVRPAGGGSLSLSAIAPATLLPGTTATITGSGFSAVPSENVVTIGGVAVPVTTASATELTVQLTGALPCQDTQLVEVVVTSPFGSSARSHPLRTAIARSLAVGEALVVAEEAGLRCNLLSEGSRYMVAVVNAAPAASSNASFELRGSVSTTALVAGAVAAPAPPRALAAPRTTRRTDVDWRAAHDVAHARLLEGDRALVRRLGAPRRVSARAGLPGLRDAVAAREVPLTVGAKDTLRVRDMNSCRTFTEVPARVVYVGPRAVILEADDSPLAGQMDADYAEIGQEFDAKMFGILTANFGNPLAFDAQTDGNGRIVMLFTKLINTRGAGLLGFVSACDFYPPSLDPLVAASNQAEVFYARVPTAATESYKDNDEKVLWKWRIRSTLIHEAKHIVSYAERFQRDADVFEESWLEEGSAQLAEELFGRTFWGTGWKTNASYRDTMYCDVRPNPATYPECTVPRPPRAIGDHVVFLHRYATDHETQTFLSPGSETSHIYGSAWAFLRFVIDNYATTEAAFLQALVTETTVSGVSNVERRTGRPFAELAANFALAMVADDLPGFTPPAGARYTLPSWNLPDIWAGANEDFPSVVTSAQPYGVRAVSLGTSFAQQVVALRGGSSTVFDLAGGAPARQLVQVVASAGTPLRVAILRVR